MGNFFTELKRRHIYRIAAAYAVVAWVALQLVNNLAPAFKLPDWSVTFVVVLLAVGFPFALIFAWLLDAKTPNAAAPKTGSGDWALAGVAAAIIAMLAYQEFAPSEPGTATLSSLDAARIAAARPAGISVAVLPFANLSGDATQEFFSDGMTEEITAALAKVSDLRVVARTSAFQFKGQNQDMRNVGQSLGATHLIEGSVRKAGARLRITAQLIKSDDGTHIWSENYDRELNDVFAIQEEIATAIASALRMPLGLKPGERLVASRSIDPDSYQQYLRAKPLVRALRVGVPKAIEILEPLVARNPDYAPAWALLAEAYVLTPTYHRDESFEELRRIVNEFLPKGEAAANRALQLDAALADGYFALSRLQARRGKYLLAEELFTKGFALDPNNPSGLNNYSSLLSVLGRLKEALAMKQQVNTLEPYTPIYRAALAEMLWLNGQGDDAVSMFKELSGASAGASAELAEVYSSMGRYAEAADILEALPSTFRNIPVSWVAEPVRLLRAAPTQAPQTLPQFIPQLAFVYLYAGAPERVLGLREQTSKAGYFSSGGTESAFLWHPSYAAVRKSQRFKTWVRTEGLVDYWRAKGWPEFCHPTTADDFACE